MKLKLRLGECDQKIKDCDQKKADLEAEYENSMADKEPSVNYLQESISKKKIEKNMDVR